MATNPITLSGLNGFDFNSIIDATIQSESAPMNLLQSQQTALQNKDAALSTVGSQITQLESTVATLSSQTSFTNSAATVLDSSIASVSTGAGAIAGTYTVNITNLATSQVTSS